MNNYEDQAVRLLRQAVAGFEAGDEYVYNAQGAARHAMALVDRGVLTDELANEITETLAPYEF